MQRRIRRYKWARDRRRRRGAVLVLAAVMMIVLLAACAFAIDVGYLYLAKAQLQRSADAAALASVATMIDLADYNAAPNPGAVAALARTTACQYVGLNPTVGVSLVLPRNDTNSVSGDLVIGHFNSTLRQFEPANTRYNAVRVRTRLDDTLNGAIPLFFGPLLGVPNVELTAEAAAYVETDVGGFRVETAEDACKLLPFTLQIGLWQARTTNRLDQYRHNPTAQTVTAGSDGVYEVNLYPADLGPGNFGTIDIGNPNNATPDIQRQILYGPNAADFAYFPNQTLALGPNGIVTLNGDTGVSSTIRTELEAIIGKPRVLPLFSQMRGNGNNAYFDVVAFVGVTVLHVQMTGALSKRHVMIQPCYVRDGSVIGGGVEGTTSKFVSTPPRLMPLP